ncbi:MAG: bifunctional UDP-sugar hydrolase/5'-nucleotidase, partial [Halobaculum sp.]
VVETFGNHDFDFGPDATRALVADADPTWVSVNVFDEDGDPFGRKQGVEPWIVHGVDGTRLGFFGVTDPATDSINPAAADLGFDDPIPAAEEAVAELLAEGVDHVVAVSHLGQGDDDIAALEGVDLVLGGHVHSERVEHVAGTLVTRPGVNGEKIVEVELGDDGATGELVTVADADAPPATDLAETLRDRMDETGLTEVVGQVSGEMERTEETIHGGESRIGNLVADAYRAAAGTEIGLQNAGGIRLGDSLSGDVTLADCIGVLPFEEPVVTVELTGAELRDVVRQMSASVVDFGDPDWWHGHVSGLEIVWDDGESELLDLSVNGETVESDRVYTLATAEYILHSDHEFPAITERHRAAEHGIQHEVLADYIAEADDEIRVDGRIERVNRSDATTARRSPATDE